MNLEIKSFGGYYFLFSTSEELLGTGEPRSINSSQRRRFRRSEAELGFSQSPNLEVFEDETPEKSSSDEPETSLRRKRRHQHKSNKHKRVRNDLALQKNATKIEDEYYDSDENLYKSSPKTLFNHRRSGFSVDVNMLSELPLLNTDPLFIESSQSENQDSQQKLLYSDSLIEKIHEKERLEELRLHKEKQQRQQELETKRKEEEEKAALEKRLLMQKELIRKFREQHEEKQQEEKKMQIIEKKEEEQVNMDVPYEMSLTFENYPKHSHKESKKKHMENNPALYAAKTKFKKSVSSIVVKQLSRFYQQKKFQTKEDFRHLARALTRKTVQKDNGKFHLNENIEKKLRLMVEKIMNPSGNESFVYSRAYDEKITHTHNRPNYTLIKEALHHEK